MSSNLSLNAENSGELLLYQTEEGLTRVEARMVNETVWLSLNQMAEMFQRNKSVGYRVKRLVNIYLEFAELWAKNRRSMYMKDWITKLDDFLCLSERDLLTHAGKISNEAAIEHAKATVLSVK